MWRIIQWVPIAFADYSFKIKLYLRDIQTSSNKLKRGDNFPVGSLNYSANLIYSALKIVTSGTWSALYIGVELCGPYLCEVSHTLLEVTYVNVGFVCSNVQNISIYYLQPARNIAFIAVVNRWNIYIKLLKILEIQ